MKNRPGIKFCLIGSPKAPAVLISLPNWQLKQEMNSAFLVCDLITGNAGLDVKGDTRNLIYQELHHRKKAVGLISREESQSSSGG